jgi:hypothetical protein
MDTLRLFYENTNQRLVVEAYLKEHVKELAVKKALAGESTEMIKDAMQIIVSAFATLEEEYGKKDIKEKEMNR